MGSNWSRTYLKTAMPRGIDREVCDRRIVETLISLHRFRGESFIDSRMFYLKRDPFSDEVAIGFSDDPISAAFLEQDPAAIQVPDRLLSVVREVLDQ